MLNSGYEINIGADQEVNIVISNSISEDNLTVFQKNFISCAKNIGGGEIFLKNLLCEIIIL